MNLPDQRELKKTGFYFAGWNENEDGTGSKDYKAGESFTVEEDTIFYANWVDSTLEFTITFDDNGATSGTVPTAITGKAGDVTELPLRGDLEKTGYEFIGWDIDEDITEADYEEGDDYTIIGDVTLFAIWAAVSVVPPTPSITYTVTFHDNDATSGTAPSPLTTDADGKVTLPDQGDLEKENYRFIGWDTDKDKVIDDETEVEYVALQEITISANIDLFAIWVVEDPEDSEDL
jgi:hypothetical protein